MEVGGIRPIPGWKCRLRSGRFRVAALFKECIGHRARQGYRPQEGLAHFPEPVMGTAPGQPFLCLKVGQEGAGRQDWTASRRMPREAPCQDGNGWAFLVYCSIAEEYLSCGAVYSSTLSPMYKRVIESSWDCATCSGIFSRRNDTHRIFTTCENSAVPKNLRESMASYGR